MCSCSLICALTHASQHILHACVHTCVQSVVDIATLTGAAGIALGQDTGAMFANGDGIAAEVEAASQAAGLM